MPGSKVFSGCDIQRQSSDITALCCYSHFDLCIFREKSAPFSAGFTAKLIPRKFKLGGGALVCPSRSADSVDLRGHGATRGNSPRRLGAIEG